VISDVKAYADDQSGKNRDQIGIALGVIPPGALQTTFPHTWALADKPLAIGDPVTTMFAESTAELSEALVELGVGEPPRHRWWEVWR
jgi:hypothetical protein